MKGRNRKNSDQSQDEASDLSVEVDCDNSPRYIPIAKLGDKPKNKKIVINLSDTQYPVVEEVAEELGWVIQKDSGIGDWDIWWTDREIDANTFFRMKLHQKVNHFPGIYILARKNLFGLGLMAMQEQFPEEYNFFPETWTVPLQFSQFRHFYESVEKGKARTFIVKPEALSQGKGIFLTRNIEDILNGNKYVIQRYVKNPLLIEKLKFDLRIYVLMAGTDPLRLYIYEEGLTRFATEEYQEPNHENLNCSYIHLTNYSLNKNNPKYVFNNSQKDMDKGHKRTLSSTYERLAKNGVDVQALKASIEDAIVKSIISGLPTIRHMYQYSQPEEYEGGMCFHILGLDVMLTDQFKPIVIEINHTPSFETGTPLDYHVKKNLVKDTLKLMRINQKNKRKNFERAKELAKIRLETGRRDIFKGKERDEMIKNARQVRDEAEKDLMGGFKRICPPYDPQLEEKYNKFVDAAMKISRQENDPRKKLLGEEKKDDPKGEKSKKVIKKAVSREERSVSQKEGRVQADMKQTLKDSGRLEIKEPIKEIFGEQSRLEYLQQEVVEESSTLVIKNEAQRSSFRTKINKKLPGSNQQLIKYTDSIKKFNELMVKFVVGKQISADILEPNQYQDSQAFHRLKQKISINKEVKSSSTGGYPHSLLNRDIKELALTPGKGVTPAIQNGGAQSLKMQIRNGSFIKPKTYMISDNREIHTMKFQKKWSGDDDHHINNKETGFGVVQSMLGGLVVENRTSKAYSKLLKPPIGRGLCLRR